MKLSRTPLEPTGEYRPSITIDELVIATAAKYPHRHWCLFNLITCFSWIEKRRSLDVVLKKKRQSLQCSMASRALGIPVFVVSQCNPVFFCKHCHFAAWKNSVHHRPAALQCSLIKRKKKWQGGKIRGWGRLRSGARGFCGWWESRGRNQSRKLRS